MLATWKSQLPIDKITFFIEVDNRLYIIRLVILLNNDTH